MAGRRSGGRSTGTVWLSYRLYLSLAQAPVSMTPRVSAPCILPPSRVILQSLAFYSNTAACPQCGTRSKTTRCCRRVGNHDDPARIEPFLSIGVDVNDNRVRDGDSALHTAAVQGSTHTVAWLLDAGADVNLRAKLDDTPLMRCMGGGHDETLKLLLVRGADYSLATRFGQNIMHVAAGWSKNLSTIKILREHGLRGLDPRIAADSGTAAAILDGREGCNQFKVAFHQLLQYLMEQWDACEGAAWQPARLEDGAYAMPGAWPTRHQD
jgi:hypothetical protein